MFEFEFEFEMGENDRYPQANEVKQHTTSAAILSQRQKTRAGPGSRGGRELHLERQRGAVRIGVEGQWGACCIVRLEKERRGVQTKERSLQTGLSDS